MTLSPHLPVPQPKWDNSSVETDNLLTPFPRMLTPTDAFSERAFSSVLVIVDVETTGLSSHDEMTELGAIAFVDGQEHSRFHTLINPGRPVPHFITSFTGITNDMVAEAPSPSTTIVDFHQWVTMLPTVNASPANTSLTENPSRTSDTSPVVLVAHNVPFDWGFLSRAALRTGILLPQHRAIDTLDWSRLLVPKPEVPSHRLKTMAAFFGDTTEQRHRSIADCLMTWSVLKGLRQRLENPTQHSI